MPHPSSLRAQLPCKQRKEIVSFGIFDALMDLLGHDFDGELAILFDLVLQGHDQASDELLPVVELYELVCDGR